MTSTPISLQSGGRSSVGVGYGLVVTAAAIWGTMGVAGAAMSQRSAMGMLDIAGLRLVMGGAVLLILAAVSGQLRLIRMDGVTLRHIALTGSLAGTFSTAYFLAVDRIGVALSTVMSLGSAPMFVVVAVALRQRRAPDVTQVLAIATAVLGLWMVAGAGGAVGVGGVDLAVGAALSAMSGAAFGLTTIVNRRHVRGMTSLNLLATSFFVGGVLTMVVQTLCGRPPVLGASPVGWGLFAFLVLVPTVGGYLLFVIGLQSGLPATSAALLSLIEVVTASLLAVALLHEHVSPGSLAGMALICGAAVTARPPRAPRPESDRVHSGCSR